MPGFELIGKEEKDAVDDVFNKGGVLYRYGFVDRRQNIFRVDDFEKEFSSMMDVKYSHAVSSGTAALVAALKGFNIRPGDEIITQSHTFIATVEAIKEIGAIPVITDVDKTLNMDPIDLKTKITEKTRVIIPVHMMGVAAKMDEILKIARKHNVGVLEDNAQSCGGTYRGKKLGTLGNAGITSFDFGKVITTGEGGMVYTNDENIFKKAREYSDHGHELNPKFPRGEDTRSISGFNFKMMELQGAIGLTQIKKIDTLIKRQRQNKIRIKEGIENSQDIEFREVPNPEGDTGDSVIFFLKDRKKTKRFVSAWTKKGFTTKNLPDAINWHFAGTWDHIFSNYDSYKNKNLESVWMKSTELLRRSIAIPVFYEMTDTEITRIINGIHASLKQSI